LSGPPSDPTHHAISLYNPDPNNPNLTWDNWADQLIQAGIDFGCPNCTGSTPNTNAPPSNETRTPRSRGFANSPGDLKERAAEELSRFGGIPTASPFDKVLPLSN
jgi:hypothetical protein